MPGGLFISADNSLLQEWTGDLADAIIPVWDAAGNPWKISAASVLTGGDPALKQLNAVGGSVENIPSLHGKTALLVFRGNNKAGDLITTGTPNGQQVKWDASTNDLTAPADNDWYPGESLTILYKV